MKRVLFLMIAIGLIMNANLLAQYEVTVLSDTIWCQYPYVMPFDNGNKVMVVWSEGNTLSDSIYMRIYENGEWGPKTAVINTGNKSQYPKLAIDSTGQIHMTWMEGVGGGRDIYYARYTNGQWSAMEPVYISSGYNSTWPSIALDGKDVIHVVWTHDYQTYSNAHDNDVWHRYIHINNTLWTGPRNVSRWRYTTSYHPALAAVGTKQFCAWMQGVLGSWSVYFSERTSGSQWTAIQNIQGGGTWPAMTADSLGNPHVLINMADGALYYRNRINGSWSGPQTLNTYARKKNFVTIKADKDDILYAAWRQGPGGPAGQENTARIFYARGDRLGNWETPELVHVGGVTKHPIIGTDVNGGVHLVWFDTIDNPTSGHAGYEYGRVFYAQISAGNSIRIVVPNGGEHWRIGEEHTLTWETTVPDGGEPVEYVKIEYSTDSGGTFNTLYESVPNTGSATGVIPRDMVDPSTQCRFRISDVNGTCSDSSNADFTLLPPYSEAGYSFNNDGTWTPAGSGSESWYLGDFSGDGLTDLLRYIIGVASEVLVSDGTSFNNTGKWTGAGNGYAGWFVGDFNGDGRDDLFRHYPEGNNMFLSNGSQFYSDGNWTPAGYGSDGWYLGDFNGDGRTDLLRYIINTGSQVLLSNGSQFINDGVWTPAGNGSDGWYIGDFNGDGRDDLMRFVAGVGSQPLLSDGTQFINDGTWTPAGTGTDGWYVGDFDGDEDADIFRYRPLLSGAEVFLAGGSQFNYDGSWTDAGKGTDPYWYIGDFNGDGKQDLLRYIKWVSTDVLLATGPAAAASSIFAYQDAGKRYDDPASYESLNIGIDTDRRELTVEEGERFLSPFLQMVERGEMPTIVELQSAYEEFTGQRVRRVTIFRLLDRHNWQHRIAGFYRPDKENLETVK
jgi:hypothetical protein